MEESENKIPEKKAKPKTLKSKKKSISSTAEPIKNISPTPTPNNSNLEITALTQEENDLFIKQINAYLSKKNSRERREPVEFKILQDTTSEFLESYITIGYSYDGQRLLMQHYPTPRDKDAILEFLKNVFVTLASKDNLIIDRDEDLPYE